MRRISLALAALSLAGCSVNLQPPAVAPVVQSTADKVILEGKRGMIYAANGYQAIAALLAPALRAGLFTNDQIDKIADAKAKADTLIAGSDTALTTAQRATALIAIVEQLHSIYAARRI